jgi:hypothetical protein
MTVSVSSPLSSPPPSFADDRYVVVSDPPPGTIVELAAGSQLALRFRRRLGPSRWHLADLPGHLLALAQNGHEFQFLVFGADGPVPLRLERRHPERDIAHEVCELLVVPISEAFGRQSRTASPRTA